MLRSGHEVTTLAPISYREKKPGTLSMREALERLEKTRWSDIRFIGFDHGSIALLLKDYQTVRVDLEGGGTKALFDFISSHGD